MLRVGIPPCEPEAVYNVRTKWIAETLAAQGKIEIVPLPTVMNVTESRSEDRPELTRISNLPDMDVLVLTRVLSERLVSLINVVRKHGLAVIVDLDDDFRNMPPTFNGWTNIQPLENPRYNWRNTIRAVLSASHMTCSTPVLQKYAPKTSTVLRNAVPEWLLSATREPHERPLVGWSGSVASHTGDLDVTRGGVASALEEAEADFRVVGNGDEVSRILNLRHPLQATGVVTHLTYLGELAKLDVLIAPLADNQFTRAKSWLTPLTASALGLWWVGSPSREYGLLHEALSEALGDRLRPSASLAGPRAREWRRELLRALKTPPLERREMCQATQEVVRSNFTYEARAEEWLDVWTRVAEGG